MGGAVHLIRRFFGSLSPLPLAAVDDRWARDHLGAGERALWTQMARADRKHAVGVARRTEAVLGPRADRAVLAAALLHDVGKVEAGLGTFHRAGATVAAQVLGTSRVVAWSTEAGGGGHGVRGRYGRYLDHAERGARLLELAGSDPLTVAWARDHHRGAGGSVPDEVADALKAADDD